MNHSAQQLASLAQTARPLESSPAGTSIARRHFLSDCGVGLGKMALSSLLAESWLHGSRSAAAAETSPAGRSAMNADVSGQDPLAARAPHYPPRAKAVIHLFMAGAPSQLELFDNKPTLTKFEGKPIPPEIIGGQRYAFIRPDAAALGPRFKFAKHGQCGAELSEMLPHLAKVVDEISLVRSCYTDQFNHAPAQVFFNTGFSQPGRPSIGSWVTYGLGAESRSLPAFVVMSTGAGISGGAANWSSGFLPSVYSGVRFRNQGDPILNVSSPTGISATSQKPRALRCERSTRIFSSWQRRTSALPRSVRPGPMSGECGKRKGTP